MRRRRPSNSRPVTLFDRLFAPPSGPHARTARLLLEPLEARVTPAAVPFALPTYHGGAYSNQAWGNLTGDFNADGNVDMVLGGSGLNALTFMPGNGDGTFQPEQLLNAGTDVSSEGIVAVDYDGDSDLDVIAYEFNQATLDGTADEGTITLYRNNGAASFTRTVVKAGLQQGYWIAAGDLNGDNRADVAYGSERYDSATNTTTAVKAFALQQPDGQLGASTTLTNVGQGSVTISDVNNDGMLDIVTAGNTTTFIPPATIITTTEVKVFLGNGDGTLAAPIEVTTARAPEVQQILDLNGDGRKDLLVYDRPTSSADGHVGYYPQQADGSFGARVNFLPNIQFAQYTDVADVNEDSILDIVSYSYINNAYRVSWLPGQGGGIYGAPVLITQTAAGSAGFHVVDIDNDSHLDLITVGAVSTTRPAPVAVLLNKTGENPMVLIPPAARTRVAGDPIELQVYFGFPITVTGTPRVALDVGGNTVSANYVSGSGTPTLTFRYTATATDLDLDGVQLASNLIDLNGGTLTDPVGGAGVLEFPNLTFSGVIVNGRGPLVQSITRLDAGTTTAGAVRFAVQFAEDVTGVDAADFAVRMNAGDLAGAGVQSVTGSGSLYEVTVSTGTGSGTLGLSVNDGASINDLNGDVLAKGYPGGEVYTVRPTAVGPIDTYYVEGHGDYRPVYNNGEFSYLFDPDIGLLPENQYQSDEVITYLDSTAIVNRPAGTNYDFIGVGAGQPYYLSNSNGNIATVPFLGWSGESLVADVFANYRPTDPRITSATLQEYVKVQMVGFRSSSGGDFSLYSGTTPTVWFATSDGIGSTDNIWLYRTHFHRNTAFSKPGTYEIDVVISGYLDGNANNALDATDVYVESGLETMVFHVDVPAAEDDSFAVSPQNTLRGSVTSNDTRFSDPAELTASVVTTTTRGTLSLLPDGSFTYVPSAAFDGADSFVYQVSNPRGGTATATVTITLPGGQHHEAVLSTEHVDLGIGYEDGEWDLHVHDETNDAEYEPYGALLHVGPAAITTRSGGLAGSEFDFLGVAAGQTLYRLPQTVNPELPFLGIGAEEVADGTFQGGEIQLRLVAVNGPGHFSMWQSTDVGPNVRFATADGITASDFAVALEGGHEHYNFAFTARGNYDVTFEAFATLPDGTVTSSGNVTYRFVVNTGADAADDAYSIDEDGTLTVGGPGVLGNDADPDGDSLVSAVVQGPANGTVTLNPDGSFTYVPNANFSGTDTFTYTTTDVRYRVVPLGTLGGNNSFALDVNNNRQVSGNSSITAGSSNPLQAYLWQNGTFVPLGVLPGTGSNNFSRGYGLNDAGVVVGESDNNTSFAFVYRDGVMSGLVRLAGDNFRGVSNDVNNGGVIVGSSSNGTTSRPTIWTFDGAAYVAADLGTIAGTGTSTGRAWAINDAGQVVGLSQNANNTSQATLWDGGTITNLTSLGDGTRFSQAFGLSGNGLVVGSSSTGQTVGQLIGTTSTTSITRAFVWDNGTIRELLPHNFFAPGNTGSTTNYHSVANDVNDAGVVVGNSQRIAGSAASATLWVDGAAMDLNALIPTGSGWVLRSAEGINRGGDVIGFGSFGGFTRAFLLVPEVTSLDGRLFSDVATVTITVNPVDDPPVATDDAYTVGVGRELRGNVLLNDLEVDGESLTAALATLPSAGTVTLNPDGSFTYVPGAGFSGTDTFTYRASDGIRVSNVATVTVTAAVPGDFQAVLTTEHVDVGIAYGSHDDGDDGHGHDHGQEEAEWDLHVHDETNDAEYAPDEALLVVGPAAQTQRTGGLAGAEFDFLGVAAGQTFYRLPQSANPELLFLGLGAEEIEPGTFAGGAITLRLKAVDGPGHFSLWQSTDAGPAVFMATSDGITAADAVTVLEGAHAHYNWGFTAAGEYRVTLQAFAYLDANGNGEYDEGVDTLTASEDAVYTFRVQSPPVVVPFGLSQTVGGGLGAVSSVFPADLDGDGDFDLLAGAYGSGVVAWFENLGGTFGPQRTIATADSVWFAIPGDLDGDGDADVIGSGYSGNFVWYANDGLGNFGPAQLIDTDTSTPYARLVDFDGDGIVDVLAAPDFGSDVRLYRGLGNGQFGPREVLISDVQNLIGLQAHDFDGDGDVDLTYGEYQTDTIHLYLNQGAGVVGPRVTIAAGDGPGVMDYADFNGDGLGDLLSLEFNADRLSWYANNGDGTFGPRQELPAIPGGPYGLATADVDGNGTIDVVSGGFSSQSHLVWVPNLGGGTFGPAVIISQSAGQTASVITAADLDGDGDTDVVDGSYSLGQVLFFENRTGEFATEVVPPAAGTYLAGYQIDVTVHFGFPVTVTGAPVLDLDVGGSMVVAEYVSGSGTPALTFRYVVQSADQDLDGIVLAGPTIRLEGGTITDPVGNSVNLSLPGADLSSVKVNGSAPFVTSVTRFDSTPTSGGSVRFQVTFSEAVTGVDPADFGLATTGGLTGATVTGVAGSGSTYTVTVGTGAGTGTIGLELATTATVADAGGNRLGAGFSGGEVFTVNRRPERVIDTFYEQGHGDLGIGYEDGEWDLHIHNDDGEFAPDEVLIYGSDAGLRDTPTGPQWEFLGAGPQHYFWPQGSSNPDVPFLGVGGEEIAPGSFASYANPDPRVNATGPWVQFQVVGVRAPAGGNFSIYTSGDTGPTVWVATSDGLTVDDSVYILAGSHNHFNWVFTAPGVYEVDFVASAFRDANGNGTYDPGIDPYTESGVTTYYFGVDLPGGPQPLTLPADQVPTTPPVAVPFSRPQTVLSGLGFPYTAAAADLTGDGKLDVLVSETDGNEIAYVANLGNGTFGPKRTIDPGTPTGFVTNSYALDADGDGDLDVFAAGDDILLYYPNDGAGNFGAAVVVAPQGTFRAVGVADLDGDGDLDVATITNVDGKAHWYRNDGGGQYALAQTMTADLAGARALAILDADGDGDTDIAVGSNGINKIVLFVNDGSGNFGPEQVITTDVEGIRNLYTADLNADGKTDLVSAAYGASELAWYRNEGNGSFTKVVVADDDTGIFAAAVADLDGDGDLDLISGSFNDSSVAWYANDGAGNFGARQVISAINGGGILTVGAGDLDGDGRADVIGGGTPLPDRTSVFFNLTGRFANTVLAPSAGTYLSQQAVDVAVHFGVPVTVAGVPEIDLRIGASTVTARYVSGAGTPTLTFRYVVAEADRDLDGVELASGAVRLAGGALTDPTGAAVGLALPAADLSGVRVNGSAPRVASITRLGPAATNADSVRFLVTFSEAVVGVTAGSFGVTAGGGVAGAAVTGLSGGGAEYVVTASTGAGSGTVGLSVGAAGISDTAGNALGVGFDGGEVYTLQRRPARTISAIYERGHGDIDLGYANGEWALGLITPEGETVGADEILIYGGPAGLRDTPAGAEFAFIGAAAGARSYYWPETGAIPDVPDLGVGGESVAPGTFAEYLPSDPRVTSSGAYVALRMVGFRGPAGGHFSVYNSGDEGPTVWLATSDGVGASDVLYAPAGSHNHYTFAFTAPGVYEVDVAASGYLDANGNGVYDEGVDPYTESGVVTYYFAIDLPGGPQPLELPADPLPQPEPEPQPEPQPQPQPQPLPRWTAVASAAGGTVRVLDAAGNEVRAVAPFAGFQGSMSAAAGDVNGDRVPDVIAGAGPGAPGGHVKVIDGATGAELHSFLAFPGFTGGVNVAAGDVNGDGFADVIVGAGPGAPGGHVKVFDGRTGAELRSFFAFDQGFLGGAQVASGDVDGDGFDDVVAAAGAGGNSHVRVFSGRTGQELRSFLAFAGYSGAVSVAAGDVDGDGRADVVVGAGSAPHVKAFSGGTGAELASFMAFEVGGVRVGVTDRDGDGRDEILAVSQSGAARTYDALSLALLDEVFASL